MAWADYITGEVLGEAAYAAALAGYERAARTARQVDTGSSDLAARGSVAHGQAWVS